jgi:hypothetical protein
MCQGRIAYSGPNMEVPVTLPRLAQGVVASLLFLMLPTETFAQAVSLAPNSHTSQVRNRISPVSTLQTSTHPLGNPSLLPDEILLSQWGHIAVVTKPTVAQTAASIPDLTYRGSSLAATPANINPFLATSINPLTTSSQYIQSTPPTTNNATSVMGAVNTIPSSRLGLAYLTSSGPTLINPLPENGSSRGIFLGTGSLISGAAGRTSATVNFSSSTLVGVPEPTSLVLGLAIFLMIGYGWLRNRWGSDSALNEEETASPDNELVSTTAAMKD